MTIPESVISRVQGVFRDVFDDPNLTVNEETVAADVSEWDSLNHINLILSLEEEFEMQFTSREVTSMSRVGDLFRLLNEKMHAGVS